MVIYHDSVNTNAGQMAAQAQIGKGHEKIPSSSRRQSEIELLLDQINKEIEVLNSRTTELIDRLGPITSQTSADAVGKSREIPSPSCALSAALQNVSYHIEAQHQLLENLASRLAI